MRGLSPARAASPHGPDVARPGVAVWWLRRADAEVVTAFGYASGERADGTVVDRMPPGWSGTEGRVVRARMRADNQQMLTVELGEQVAAEPGLVLVERLDRDATPLSVDLVAFLHDDVASRAQAAGLAVVPPGTFLTARDVQRLGLTAADQVGAVRWEPASGQAREVYVDPAHRRRHIATALFFTAEAVAVARGWPTLWADGVRTALGQAAYRVWRWGVRRAAPLTAVAPPMTPRGEEAGRLAPP